MQDENRNDDQGASGRARLRTFEENEERRQYHWLLLIPLLALGYGFYTQFDRVRDMLTPDPVVEAEPSPPTTPAPTAAAPAASVLAPVAKIPEASRQSVELPVPVAPAPKAVVQEPPPLAVLFATPAEPARTAGKTGLVEALRNRELRPATAGDFNRWKTSYARHGGGNARNSFENFAHRDAYVVQKDFEIPAGLHGAHAVVFLVEPRVPFPRGDAGHSPILDMESGACIGVTCRMLMSEE